MQQAISQTAFQEALQEEEEPHQAAATAAGPEVPPTGKGDQAGLLRLLQEQPPEPGQEGQLEGATTTTTPPPPTSEEEGT